MFQTGEFSKIARVSKRLLQYYDEIGLLKPAYTDPQTGYRYYSAQQLPRLNRILALKDLGLTLDQIMRLLADDVSDDEIRGMLMLQKAELEQKLLADMQRFRRIETRLQDFHNQDVVLKTIPDQTILSVQHFCLNPQDGLAFVGYLMSHLPSAVEGHKLGHFVVMADQDDFRSEEVDLEFGFFVEPDVTSVVVVSEDIVMETRTLPAVEVMATTVHAGGPNAAHLSYGALAGWIEANGYRIVGQPREIFLHMSLEGQEESIVMEIQIPVENVRPTNLVLPNLL